jgi:hypothetical protein
MQTQESVSLLLQEAVAALSLPAALVLEGNDNPAWRVTVEEGRTLDVEYVDALRRVMVTADIGPVADHARAELYETLLQYNFIWTETGSVRMALNGMDGHVNAMVETAVSELDAARFSSLLANMGGLQRTWAEILGAWTAPGADSRTATNSIAAQGLHPAAKA